ncbi:hypothetical protein HPS57_07905 [Prevotella sp. PINT]|jgi:hypothetical protein|uniref:DUF6242 domain-containing protein n=1 Tax=Palleniella intestinalis TaxID=2736291 RepID=UPI00155725D5|nr:DUF6242 domain-containing protein [Palleniella intestinalis]NPD81898.1 hypothetical protein [Palleniella intestinalis]
MSNKHSIAAIIITAVAMLSSCIDDNNVEITYYDDVAVTAFSLGNISHTVYTKKKTDPTQDSSYVETLSYINYPFHIDNSQNRIYNTDSILSNTHIEKSLANITVKNSGYMGWKNLDDDQYTEFSSADTVDLSKPRILRVVANDGSWFKDYTVTVLVHTEGADSLYWEDKGYDANISKLANIRGTRIGKKIIVYGTENGTQKAYAANNNDGQAWQELRINSEFPVSMATNSTKGFALMSNGTVLSSEDGENWITETTNADMRQLITASSSELYSMGNKAEIITLNLNDKTVRKETLKLDPDDKSKGKIADPDNIYPTKDIQGYTTKIITNPEMERVTLIGNNETDSIMTSWVKIIDNSNTERSQKWAYQIPDNTSKHLTPALENASITTYGTGALLIGGKRLNLEEGSEGAKNNKPYENIYFSPDNGKNWRENCGDTQMYLPKGFSTYANSAALINDGSHFWIICGGTGHIWKGHITTFSWR